MLGILGEEISCFSGYMTMSCVTKTSCMCSMWMCVVVHVSCTRVLSISYLHHIYDFSSGHNSFFINGICFGSCARHEWLRLEIGKKG